MVELYPLTFNTIFKDKIWGGEKIRSVLNKDFSPLPNCGETWELSSVPGNVSIAQSGALKDKALGELISLYKGDLVGEKVYEQFGDKFPLLIKFIDANDDLSIQVHPDDEVAKRRHDSRGKTEMWYVIQADDHSRLIAGFNKKVSREEYIEHLNSGTLDEILNYEPVYADDVFFMPAGRVHSIGRGILLAEIQETSDVTYRIYDFDRTNANGETRELHTQEALDVIDYNYHDHYKTFYEDRENEATEIVRSEYFTTHKLLINKEKELDMNYDSFTILICLDGELLIDRQYSFKKGDVYLLPAIMNNTLLSPQVTSKVLSVHI